MCQDCRERSSPAGVESKVSPSNVITTDVPPKQERERHTRKLNATVKGLRGLLAKEDAGDAEDALVEDEETGIGNDVFEVLSHLSFTLLASAILACRCRSRVSRRDVRSAAVTVKILTDKGTASA